jgi:hypothetical protein
MKHTSKISSDGFDLTLNTRLDGAVALAITRNKQGDTAKVHKWPGCTGSTPRTNDLFALSVGDKVIHLNRAQADALRDFLK